MKKSSVRYAFIDYAKIIGIWIVVLGHYTYAQDVEFVNNGVWHLMFDVTLFHMPLFFIISGMLYKPTDIHETIKKGWTQLLVPYLIMATIGLLLEFFLGHFNIMILLKGIAGIISGNDMPRASMSYTRPLWFLYALFLIKMYMSINKELKCGLGGAIGALLGIVILYWGNKLWFRVDSALSGFVFFYIGYSLKDLWIRIDRISIIWKIALVFFCLIILVLTAMWNIDYETSSGALSLNMIRAGKYPFLFLISGIVGTIMILSIGSLLSTVVNNCSYCKSISNGTIVLLGFHMMVYIFIIKPIFNVSDNIIIVIGLSTLNFLICVCVAMICNKYFPALLGNRK